ncbi:putative U3 small nucleolar RNA-associated protein 7 [Coemansia sp. RSA 988]|nr:putative U3 small nucleolar RNA-associated protein 7 [Coemansia sp. RSA 988]
MSAVGKLANKPTKDRAQFTKGMALPSPKSEDVSANEESASEQVPRTLRDTVAKSDNKKSKKHSNKQSNTAEEDDAARELQQRAQKYKRGTEVGGKVRSKKAQAGIDHAQKRRAEAVKAAARSEMLLTESSGYLEAEGTERTFKFTQRQIADNVDIGSTEKMFNLKLDEFGPYSLQYSTNGRHMLLGGRRGHIAYVDWRNGKLGCELHVRETVRDVCWLHNESLFAVAQKRQAYIYDHTGAEVHCLSRHVEPTALGFLPHHMLLASTGLTGKIVYQDVTEGRVAGEHRSGYGPSHVLRVSPYNAVAHVGHGNGMVTLWGPQQPQALAKVQCHRGPIQALALDNSGTYMATSGLDGRVRVWDIRRFEPLHEYRTARPAQTLDISQRGLLAAGWGRSISIWKDALSTRVDAPYMRHQLEADVSSMGFVPYDDVLGCGHAQGVASVLVPGAGEPNFDALVANPFQTPRQRQEAEVRMLLDKLPVDSVQLDPNFIGRMDPRSRAQQHSDSLADAHARHADTRAAGAHLDSAVRNKTKGRNSTAKRYARKRNANIVDLKRLQEMERMEKDLRESAAKRRKAPLPAHETGALNRFYAEKNNTR